MVVVRLFRRAGRAGRELFGDSITKLSRRRRPARSAGDRSGFGAAGKPTAGSPLRIALISTFDTTLGWVSTNLTLYSSFH